MSAVPRLATPWRRADYLAAMSDAILTLTGKRPPRVALAILWAQSVLECGRHGAVEGPSCWCNNVGNLRGVAPDGSFTVLPGAWERDVNGAIVYPVDQRFRAYTSLAAGASDMLTVLSRQANFARAWAVLTGDAPASHPYVEALYAGRYFTADPTVYANNNASLAAECLRTTLDGDWPPTGAQMPPPAWAYAGPATPLRVPADDDDADTLPDNPVAIRRSSQRIAAVDTPIIDDAPASDRSTL